MSYVIAFVGSGGKTSFMKDMALDLYKKGKKVLITTTTHIFDENIEGIDIVGAPCDNGKISYVGDEKYYNLCEEYDYVLVEADGSKTMPMKIPNYDEEPVIPKNVNEIYCFISNSAVGRKISAVCHRYFEQKDVILKNENIPLNIFNSLKNENYIVTNELLNDYINYFYISYLEKQFPNVKINKIITDIEKDKFFYKYKNIAFCIMASGFSKRFGENKLLYTHRNGNKQYENIIEIVIDAKNKLKKYFTEKFDYNIDFSTSIITQYDEIIKDDNIDKEVVKIKNDNAIKGLSNTIHLAIKNFKNEDAICFIPADLITLSSEELFLFIKNYLCMKKGISCMFTDKKMSPCIIQKKYYDEALQVEGDKGLRDLLSKHLIDIENYHICEKDLQDCDTKEDLKIIGDLR